VQEPNPLDLEQLRDVTMDDAELMRELLSTLIDDTARQLHSLEQALSRADAREAVRLAHYSKGACANVGAQPTAVILQQIETRAKEGDLQACGQCMPSLWNEFHRLEAEAAALNGAS
jgi:HPt (histidine-containing phosphotransfer) domain-containing protein